MGRCVWGIQGPGKVLFLKPDFLFKSSPQDILITILEREGGRERVAWM